MPATIRDIRDMTGLSLATISKYLNGGNVLPENRIKIESAIKELHYEVNEMARGLVTNKTKTIGIVVQSIESLFCGTLLKYMGSVLRKNGYGVLICDSSGDEEVEKENIKYLVSKKVDGIIVIPIAKKSDFLAPAKKAEVPVILVDRSLADGDYDCIKIDNRIAAKKATNKLIASGHTKIAIIYSSVEYTGIERYRGFMEALDDAGIVIPDEYIKQGRHSIEHGHNSMSELLKLKDRPTAVFTSNYEVTLGTVMAVNESKYSCPEDISLMGFDNLILSHVVRPKMNLVVQPMKEIGEKAAKLILTRVNEKEKSMPMEYIMGTKIEEGNSIRNLNL